MRLLLLQNKHLEILDRIIYSKFLHNITFGLIVEYAEFAGVQKVTYGVAAHLIDFINVWLKLIDYILIVYFRLNLAKIFVMVVMGDIL